MRRLRPPVIDALALVESAHVRDERTPKMVVVKDDAVAAGKVLHG